LLARYFLFKEGTATALKTIEQLIGSISSAEKIIFKINI
jgi:hypothetical protein